MGTCSTGLLNLHGSKGLPGNFKSHADFSRRAHVSHFIKYVAFVLMTGGQEVFLPFIRAAFYNLQNTFTSLNVMFEF